MSLALTFVLLFSEGVDRYHLALAIAVLLLAKKQHSMERVDLCLIGAKTTIYLLCAVLRALQIRETILLALGAPCYWFSFQPLWLCLLVLHRVS